MGGGWVGCHVSGTPRAVSVVVGDPRGEPTSRGGPSMTGLPVVCWDGQVKKMERMTSRIGFMVRLSPFRTDIGRSSGITL